MKPRNKDEQIFLFKAFLNQISKMYDNPELKRTIRSATSGHWEEVFYEKYKPTLPKLVDTEEKE